MDSPAYKNWINKLLKEFVLSGLINIEMFLTHCNFPFADAILEDLRNWRERVQQSIMTSMDVVSGISQTFNQQAQKAGVEINNIHQVVNMMNPRRAVKFYLFLKQITFLLD